MTGSAGAAPLFARSELAAGLPARRAAAVLFAIENRTARLVIRSRRALERYVAEGVAARAEEAFLAALAEGRAERRRPSIRDLERHAPSWADLVAPDPALRATIGRRFGERHRFRARDVPRLRAALGLDDPATADAHRRLFGAPVSSIYADRLPIADRAAWTRSRIGGRLEDASPFWWAFSLTLTETVGAGVLALPVALAGVGILPAIVLLVVFGFVNVLTVGALAEAITRDGAIRYGTAYLGRLVEDLLGRSGRRVVSVALFVLGVVTVPAYVVGVAAALSSVTGLPGVVFIGLLGAATLVILRHGSLDATVATAILVGATNIVLLLAISVIALAHADPGRFVATPTGPGLSAAGLVFGVVLGAYFGHTAAATSAKVVLARDPSGRSLLRGNVAAMAAAVAIYVLVVVAILGAVPASALIGSSGTAIEPLAREVGPVVGVLGGIFVVLAMGLATVIASLALYNQTLEVLLDQPFVERRLRGRSLLTWVAAVAPIVTVFVVTTIAFSEGRLTFAGPMALLGTVCTPIVAGVFPALLLVAARRRGEYPTAAGLPGLGRPIVATILVGLFVVGALVQGWLVARDPGTELATAVVAVTIAAVAVQAVRSGAFRPRAVLEVVSPERPGPDGLGLVVAGRRAAPAEVSSAGGRTTLTLPPVSELAIWAHRVTDDGDTVPVTLAVRAISGEPRELGTTDGDGRLTTFLDGQGTTIELRHLARGAGS